MGVEIDFGRRHECRRVLGDKWTKEVAVLKPQDELPPGETSAGATPRFAVLEVLQALAEGGTATYLRLRAQTLWRHSRTASNLKGSERRNCRHYEP